MREKLTSSLPHASYNTQTRKADQVDKRELERLVAAAQRGDTAAFARLTNANYRLVYGLAYSTVGDWAAAQDIAQDTFVVAWTHLGNLRGAGAAAPSSRAAGRAH